MDDQQNDNNLLDDWKKDMYVDPVSPGVRFANYLVDGIVLVIIFRLLGPLLGLPNNINNVNAETQVFNQAYIQALMHSILVSLIVQTLYYTLLEGFTGGRTIGKFVTGTIAIKDDGSAFTFKDAFLRTLCRFIPFEALSTFGYRPWHDSLTKTAVVKKTW